MYSYIFFYLGRITGLDPAGPNFDGMSPLVRLDQTDASFVDIIHSDAEILYPYQFAAGVSISCGQVLFSLGINSCYFVIYIISHVDFWPNGGRNQPCILDLVELIAIIINYFYL